MKHVMRCAVVVSFALIPLAANAASVQLVMNPDAGGVGSIVPAQIVLTTSGPEGPGEVEVTLEWGADFQTPTQFGAVLLHTMPTSGTVGSLTNASDCFDGFKQYAGSCTMTVQISQVLDGGFSIAELAFRYEWVPPDGYEVCSSPGTDPECHAASDRATVSGPATVFGTPGGVVGETGTFVAFGLTALPPEEVPVSGPIGRVLLPIGLLALGAVGARLRGRPQG